MNSAADGEQPVRVAVLSLMPDLGHVAPLLRIARAAVQRGLQVHCFVPEDARVLVEQFELPVTYAPSPRPADADEVLQEVSAGGRWPRSIVAAEAMKDRYLVPTHLAIHDALEEIARSIEAFGPDVVVADDLGEVRPTVRALAGRLGLPLLLHSASGSRITAQSEAIRRWGAPERWWKKLAAWAEGPIRVWRSRLLRVLRPGLWRERRDARLRVEEAVERLRRTAADPPSAEASFATGLGILEAACLEGSIRTDDDRLYLGPVDPGRPAPLDEELARWLDASDRPVVLLSFGTHLRPAPEEIADVVEGIHTAGSRCLWATRHDADVGAGFDARNVRVEPFVPQPTVLAHPSVEAFVTHGGSGGIQEALWSGVPLLCIPLQWDQHYNADVVARLGCGISVARRRITADRIREAVSALVDRDHRYVRRATEVGSELRAADGAGRTVRLIERMAGR